MHLPSIPKTPCFWFSEHGSNLLIISRQWSLDTLVIYKSTEMHVKHPINLLSLYAKNRATIFCILYILLDRFNTLGRIIEEKWLIIHLRELPMSFFIQPQLQDPTVWQLLFKAAWLVNQIYIHRLKGGYVSKGWGSARSVTVFMMAIAIWEVVATFSLVRHRLHRVISTPHLQ